MKSQVLEQLAEIKKTTYHNTDNIVDFIGNQQSKINALNDKVEELENENSDIQDEVDKVVFEYPNGFNNNIVMVSTLEKMFTNLDRIPVDKLDEFVDKYAI